ncbi:MAG: extracellular solute-binding protein [Cyanobacteria bacterium P01_H01_bin.15]
MWRKISRYLAIAICTLFLLTGCGRTSDLSSAIKITLWHGINPPSNRIVFQGLIEQFNDLHPEIEVEALYIGQPDNQLPKILAAVISQETPDLLWFVPQLTGELLKLGALRPLDTWWDSSSRRDELLPALLETMELEGHIWSVPLATNNAAIFFRPSLFVAAGLDVPKALNWSDFAILSEKLTRDLDGDGRNDQHGVLLSLGKGEWTVFTWLPFIFGAGGELLTDTGAPQLQTPEIAAALNFGANLVNQDWAILSAPERGYELDDWLAGRVAMQITGPWNLGYLQSLDVDWDVLPLPYDIETDVAVLGGENIFAFPSTSEQEQAANLFLDYLLSRKFQLEWALQTGYLPINRLVGQSERYQEFVAANPALRVFLAQMTGAKTRPIIAGYTQLSENLGRAIETTLLGEEAETALAASQKRLDLIFNQDP